MDLARIVLELRGCACIEILDRDAAREGQVMFSRSFSSPITTPGDLVQVLSIHAQKVTGRLRRRDLEVGGSWAFASTSWHKDNYFQSLRRNRAEPVHQTLSMSTARGIVPANAHRSVLPSTS